MVNTRKTETTTQAVIGVDVGGTHTDVAVAIGGRVERGKALTTYDDFSRGLLEAVTVAAERFGLTLSDLLHDTQLFFNGTTVVTNIITQLNGSHVGVLATAGFTDTFRLAGGPRGQEIDDHLQVNVPDIVARDAIVPVQERIDYAGKILVPIDLDEVRQRARHLVEDLGVDALAICFLSSYANPEHELAAERVIREQHPDIFITPSHRVFSIAGETRRWTTAVLNSFVQRRTELYLTSLDTRLREAGLRKGLAFFQGLGGAITLEKAKEYPLAMLGSGPAAGAIGANELARRMGRHNVLLGDMGGTSFDTGIISDNEVHIEKNLQIGPFQTGVNLVDVVSVGAGGGSIASISERGVPNVGPQSAGSTPGPAGLGRGGEQPTVTDAMIVMGIIDPDRYLGGRVQLKPELSREALESTFGERFGWSADEAASAVHDLVVVNMANAVREVSVDKGHDPRDFMFLAYGGTLPMFAAQIAARLGISTVVIPQNSSVFCALGLLSSDFVVRADQAVGWELDEVGDLPRVNATADEMVGAAVAAMHADGFDDQHLEVARSADFKFAGQHYELTMPVPARELEATDGAILSADFFDLYERTYGEGTAWAGVPTTMVNYSVTVRGRHAKPAIDDVQASNPASPVPREHRDVFLPGTERRELVPIYDDVDLTPGATLTGPAIIDATDTTIFVPTDVRATRDHMMNLVLTQPGD